ncbi:MAG: 4'-phosphopantetheinyl transferase superfamily protein [Steroidobacteraceae bacterium]
MDAAHDHCRAWWTLPAAGESVPRTRRDRRTLERDRCNELLADARPRVGEPVSCTHSHGCAGIAVGPPGTRVGIDLERETDRDYVRLAELAYSPAESAWLRGLDATKRRQCFYRLWTLKEAFAKALGLDLATALAQVRLEPVANGIVAVVPTDASWSAAVFSPHPGFRMAVVSVAASGVARAVPIDFAGPPDTGHGPAHDLIWATGPCSRDRNHSSRESGP